MTTPPPLTGAAAQLESLARILLGLRSSLEAIVTTAETLGKPAQPITAMTHATIDQLDAGFVLVNALQATADMTAALERFETPAPSSDGRPEMPPVFGQRRRAAAAAAQESTNQPGATDGRKQGGTPPRGEAIDAAGERNDSGTAEGIDRGPERAGVGPSDR